MKHAERRILQKTILLLLSAATIGFIFSNSMETIPESSAKSEELLCVLTPALELFIGKGNATNHLIRKLAHYAEFFVLGTELCLLCSLLKKQRCGDCLQDCVLHLRTKRSKFSMSEEHSYKMSGLTFLPLLLQQSWYFFVVSSLSAERIEHDTADTESL